MPGTRLDGEPVAAHQHRVEVDPRGVEGCAEAVEAVACGGRRGGAADPGDASVAEGDQVVGRGAGTCPVARPDGRHRPVASVDGVDHDERQPGVRGGGQQPVGLGQGEAHDPDRAGGHLVRHPGAGGGGLRAGARSGASRVSRSRRASVADASTPCSTFRMYGDAGRSNTTASALRGARRRRAGPVPELRHGGEDPFARARRHVGAAVEGLGGGGQRDARRLATSASVALPPRTTMGRPSSRKTFAARTTVAPASRLSLAARPARSKTFDLAIGVSHAC